MSRAAPPGSEGPAPKRQRQASLFEAFGIAPPNQAAAERGVDRQGGNTEDELIDDDAIGRALDAAAAAAEQLGHDLGSTDVDIDEVFYCTRCHHLPTSPIGSLSLPCPCVYMMFT